MKKLLFLVILIMTVCALKAQECCVNGICYYLTSDGAYVKSNNGWGLGTATYSGAITIPSSITYSGTTYTVTRILYNAFAGCSSLSSVTIPNSVDTIDFGSFSGCSSLSSITIPNSVNDIGVGAFSGCSSLSSVIVSSGNQVYDSRNNCNAIIKTSTNTLVIGFGISTIPNTVTSIGYAAFSGCTNLSSITIPNSVASIDAYAFDGCSSLSSITIPNTVTSIGAYAFDSCSSLSSITIPNSLTSISEHSFADCTSLNNVSFPNTVTLIGNDAFSGCSSLSSLALPNSLKTIRIGAFNNCTSLDTIIVPYSVDSLGAAFGGCSSLRYIVLPNPTLGSNQVCDIGPNLTICIPRSLLYNYQIKYSRWGCTLVPLGAEVTLTSNDEMMGRGVGSGIYDFKYGQSDSTVRIAASAYTGYRFKQWNDGNTQNPRNVVLNHDTTFQAVFEAGMPSGDTVYVNDTIYVHDTVYIAGENDTIYLEYDGRSATEYSLEDYGVYYYMSMVVNRDGRYIKLYAADGKLIASGTSNIDMSYYANGIYIVTDGKGGFLKINHYKNE